MAKFKILQIDPLEQKNKILEFWEKYLPGASPERFDWLQSNPEGPTIWFFAFDAESNELAGMISLMKHDLSLDGKLVHAGIMGDFMVGDKYRVFGPAILLQEAVVGSKRDLNLDFLYTVPSLSSLKLALRIGYLEKIKLRHMVRPLKTDLYILRSRENKYLKKIVCTALDKILMRLPIGVFLSNNDKFKSVAKVDKSFDDFWLKIKSKPSRLQGNRESEYLSWRYCQNPNSKFKFLKYIENQTEEVLGYIVYSTYKNKISIYDLVSKESRHIDKLLKKLLQIAYNEKCQAIYIRLSYTNPVVNKLKKFFFFDAKDDISILVFDDGANYSYENWNIFEHDRNI